MFQMLRTATILFGLLTILTGVAYPIAVTLFAQVAFPREANGSLFEKPKQAPHGSAQANWHDWRSDPSHQGTWAGSDLIGQPFAGPGYFWGRPSSTAPVAYNSLGGSGSNQATTNPALLDAVRERIAKLRAEDPDNRAPIPVDLVTASASGLDPHISEAAAIYQIARVARVRKIDPATVTKLVLNHLERPTIGILGHARVNVLKLNLSLDLTSPQTDVAKPAVTE
jgi:K+-transporting ATPase ATPase C chain